MRQDQESGLEGVLGVVMIPDDAPADAQHHRAVPLNQGGKGQLGEPVTACQELFHELPIGQAGDRPLVEDDLDLPKCGADFA